VGQSRGFEDKGRRDRWVKIKERICAQLGQKGWKQTNSVSARGAKTEGVRTCETLGEPDMPHPCEIAPPKKKRNATRPGPEGETPKRGTRYRKERGGEERLKKNQNGGKLKTEKKEEIREKSAKARERGVAGLGTRRYYLAAGGNTR